MGCFDCIGYTLLKLLVVGGNFVFVILGIGLIGIGIYAKVTITNAIIASSGIQILPILLVLFGCGVIIISLLGLCGASRENRWLLGLYLFILILLTLSQIALVIAGFVERGKIPEILEEGWEKMKDDDRNLIQKEFNCCGFQNPSDNPGTVCPPSNSTNSTTNAFDTFFFVGIFANDSSNSTANNSTQGCEPTLENFVSERVLIVVGAGFGLLAVEIFALIFTWCLISALPTKEDAQYELLEEARMARRFSRQPERRSSRFSHTRYSDRYGDDD